MLIVKRHACNMFFLVTQSTFNHWEIIIGEQEGNVLTLWFDK